MDSQYDPQNSILDAAHAGNAKAIERLLRKVPDRVGERGPRGMQPLHFASNAVAAEALVRFGALVDARTDWGETPLHFAARNGHQDVAEVLVRRGGDPSARDHRGDTPLYFATHSPAPGAHDDARYLMCCGADLDLNSALALRMLDRARCMLLDPDACRRAPHPELLPRLAVWVVYEAIADAVGRSDYVMMTRRGKYKLDPAVIKTVVAGHIDLLQTILAQGAPMSYWSFEALKLALELPEPAVAELLLQAGAGSPEWAQMDIASLDRHVERSACKDAIRGLLRRYSFRSDQ